MHAYRRYVILTHGRTGSTSLTRILRDHSRIVDYQELFNVDYQAEWRTGSDRAEALHYWLNAIDHRKLRQRPDLRSLPTASEAEILDKYVWHGGYAERVQAVGFKLLHYQMNPNGAFPALHERIGERAATARIVILTRRNLLKLYLSHVVAKRVRQWHVVDEHQRKPRPRISLTPEDLTHAFRHYERSGAELLSLARQSPHLLALAYEDLVSDLPGHWKQLLEFLEIAWEPMPDPRLVKIENRTLREAIANYEALKDHFRGSSCENYFDE